MTVLHQIKHLNIHSYTIPGSSRIRLDFEDTSRSPGKLQSLCSFIPDSGGKQKSAVNCWKGHFAEAGIEDAEAAANELYAVCVELNKRRIAACRAANSGRRSLKQSELRYLAAQYGKTFEELYAFIGRHASGSVLLQLDNPRAIIALDIDTLIQQVADYSGLLEEELRTFLML